MRGFAQTLFNALLGWIKALVEAVWSLLFSDGTQKWMEWISANWLTLVVLLCLLGVAADFIVWFLRWRPYYVWGTQLRRLGRLFGGGKSREKKAPAPVQPPPPRQARPPRGQSAPSYAQEYMAPTRSFSKPAWEESQRAAGPLPETIQVRPRQADFQEQYVRRFARPEPQPAPRETLFSPPYAQQDAAWEEPFAQEEYPGYEQEPAPAEELPAPPLDPGPIHPGIDYQALSRQYGWDAAPASVPAEEPPEEEPQEEEEQAEEWNSQGLEQFSPYVPPAPPALPVQTAAPAQAAAHSGRARKAKEERPVLSWMKDGLGRVVQRAGRALTVDDEDETKLLDGLPPPIDKAKAFHAPVYPGGRKPPNPQNPDFREDD